jgi:glutathione synthase/RimK-type ligase-like ATP-grasp enzyme
MTAPTVALVTCRDLPDLDEDDRPVKTLLEARGAVVLTPAWDAGPFDADLVVIRNTWDYTTRRAAFLAFIDDVAARTTLANPADVIRDNSDKIYLERLQALGVPTVPTVSLAQGTADAAAVDAALARLPSSSGYVLKPRVGAGSRATIKVPSTATGVAEAKAFLVEHLPREPLLIQPFLPRIDVGEASLIYIDGAFSHAVNKTPKGGDFRSQPDFGAQVVAHAPSAAQRALADRVMHLVGGARLLYARVDLVVGLDGAPALIEAELTEPSLYLAWDDGAAARLADATWRRATR